jgi:ribosomal 50S subunit-recycling heat shock protein
VISSKENKSVFSARFLYFFIPKCLFKIIYLNVYYYNKLNEMLFSKILVADGIIPTMRVDKYINSVNITKRRSISEDMCRSGVVFINGLQAKASKDVKVGDTIEIRFIDHVKKYRVLQIPQTKTIPKTKQSEYVEEL